MKSTAALALSLSLAGGILLAQDDTVDRLLSKDLVGVPFKDVSTITVGVPARSIDPDCIRIMRRRGFTYWKVRS